MPNLVEFYYLLVKSGKKTLAQVPAKWRDAVEARLYEEGVDDEAEG